MNNLLSKLNAEEFTSPYLESIARISLALGLGNFICILPLYFQFGRNWDNPKYLLYVATTFFTGCALIGIALLCRYSKIRTIVPYFCLAILLIQLTYLITIEEKLFYPVALIFPLICSLSTPILSRPRASYWLSAVNALQLLAFHFLVFHYGKKHLPELVFFAFLNPFSAYVTENLWGRIRRRERELEQTLNELHRKTIEMENWIERMGRASSLISTGQFTGNLPTPPPYRVFEELTRSMEQMQEKLSHYFTNLFLQDRLNSVGVLASGVAHELNTPLTSMQYMVEGNEGIPLAAKKDLLEEIQRMSKITRNLLHFAHPHQEREFVDLNTLIRESTNLVQHVISKRVKLSFNLSHERLPVKVSSNEIQQVLINLLTNASDAVEHQPQPLITISTFRNELNQAVLQINDNGSGMDSQTLSKVMNPFFTTKEPGKGTGLGLFIVHQITQRHSAMLEMKSTANQGTTVILNFPLLSDEKEKEVKRAA